MGLPAKDPKILAVDSSSLAGSVALCEGDRLVAESLLNIRSTHSEKLLKQVDLLLQEVGWQLSDLDLLAAVTGPGSFTGLRIGVATVKGLAQVLGKPVVGISALDMLAMNLPLCPVPICVFMDARKQEVYSRLYHWGEQGPVAAGRGQVIAPEKLLQQLKASGKVALVGDGVLVYRELIDKHLAQDALLPVSTAHQPRASQAAWLAHRDYQNGLAVAAGELLPSYIRPSDAELNLSKI